MSSNRQFVLFFIFILLTLFLRDLPYFNVLFINRLWFVYFVLLLFVLFARADFRVTVLWLVTFILFLVAIVLTVIKFLFFAETIGIFIYFLLWMIVIYRLIGFVRKQ